MYIYKMYKHEQHPIPAQEQLTLLERHTEQKSIAQIIFSIRKSKLYPPMQLYLKNIMPSEKVLKCTICVLI